MNTNDIISAVAHKAREEGSDILLIIPHLVRPGRLPSATVLRTVAYGIHPLVVHTAAIRDSGIQFGRGDYFHKSEMSKAVEQTMRRAVIAGIDHPSAVA